MPTTYTDQFYIIDPYSPPAFGTALNFNTYTILDGNDDDSITGWSGDQINGITVTNVYNGDTITVRLGYGSVVTIVGVTSYRVGEPAVFTPLDGTVLENVTFLSSSYVNPNTSFDVDDLGPPCFTLGTPIMTPTGERMIEDIEIGDMVSTRDHGAQPIRWIGITTVDGRRDYAPIRFSPNAMGNEKELIVSPQHRMLVRGWQAELYYGEEEVLVAAKHLVNGDTIHIMRPETVTYIHLMFDDHEILTAGGIMSESFDPCGDLALNDTGTRAEILALFPEFQSNPNDVSLIARPVIRKFEASLLIH